MTYSEMRSAYELSQAFDRDVYIGNILILRVRNQHVSGYSCKSNNG